MLLKLQGRWAPRPETFARWDAAPEPEGAAPGSVASARGWVELLVLEPLPTGADGDGLELIRGALAERFSLHPTEYTTELEIHALTGAQSVLVLAHGRGLVPPGYSGLVQLRLVTEAEVDLDTGAEMLAATPANLARLVGDAERIAVMKDRRWFRIFARKEMR